MSHEQPIRNLKELAKEPSQIGERQCPDQTGTSIAMHEPGSVGSRKQFECLLDGEHPAKSKPKCKAMLDIELDYAPIDSSKRRVSGFDAEGVINLCAGRRNP
ncbi:MAG: hypothetical protein B7Z52_02475 [Burkholderiales bacterium 12-64-5]|nr:MAG: hypothetical protein B7Z52_02475 [Burkholderiales bacterium 12-64-5]